MTDVSDDLVEERGLLPEGSRTTTSHDQVCANASTTGSRGRFKDLYGQEFSFVWRTLRRLGIRESEAEDAAQEVWIVVHRHLHRLDPAGSPRPWLFTIARRVAWRQRRTRARAERKNQALALVSRRSQAGFDANLEAREQIESYLNNLPTEQRKVFILAELLSMTGKEIAATLGVKQATVYSRLRLARKRLDSMIGERGDEVVARLRRAERPTERQRMRSWALLLPSLGAPLPGSPIGSLPGSTAPPPPGSTAGSLPGSTAAPLPGTLAPSSGWGLGKVLGERAVAALVASPASTGLVSAALATLVFAAAMTRPSAPEAGARGAHEFAALAPQNDRTTGIAGRAASSKDAVQTPTLEPGPQEPRDLALTDSEERRGQGTSRAGVLPGSRARSNVAPLEASIATPGASESTTAAQARAARDTDDPLAREVALLSEARLALAGHRPAKALRLLDQHVASFRQSSLLDVREASRVEALCALGRETDAVKLATSLSAGQQKPAVKRVASAGCQRRQAMR